MAAKKKISTADLKKLVKEAHKLDPMKPIPASTAKKMDSIIESLAAQEKATSRGNVKILPGKSNKQRQKIMNAQSTAATENAKSGATASRYADERDYQMQKRRNSAVSRIKTVKIRSGGLGGMYSPKNK